MKGINADEAAALIRKGVKLIIRDLVPGPNHATTANPALQAYLERQNAESSKQQLASFSRKVEEAFWGTGKKTARQPDVSS